MIISIQIIANKIFRIAEAKNNFNPARHYLCQQLMIYSKNL